MKLFRNSKKLSDRHAERSRGISLALLNGPDGTSEMPRLRLAWPNDKLLNSFNMNSRINLKMDQLINVVLYV